MRSTETKRHVHRETRSQAHSTGKPRSRWAWGCPARTCAGKYSRAPCILLQNAQNVFSCNICIIGIFGETPVFCEESHPVCTIPGKDDVLLRAICPAEPAGQDSHRRLSNDISTTLVGLKEYTYGNPKKTSMKHWGWVGRGL